MLPAFIPFCFAVTTVSLLATKAVHLYIHGGSLSIFAFALYLPSLLLSDVFWICLSRLALRRENGLIAIFTNTMGATFAFIMLGGAASQFGFWWETGNEIIWADALGFAKDREGMKVLLSGSGAVVVSGMMLLTISWLTRWYLYRAVGAVLVAMGAPIVYAWRAISPCRTKVRTRRRHYSPPGDSNPDFYDTDSTYDSEVEDDAEQAMSLVYGDGYQDTSGRTTRFLRKTSSWAFISAILVFLGVTMVVRPQTPYTMMATTLPMAMMEMFKSKPDMCVEQARLNGNRWPFPDMIDATKWEYPNQHLHGWAPGANNWISRKYRDNVPEWLPHPAPSGFNKWFPDDDEMAANGTASEAEHKHRCPGSGPNDIFYNPVSDPIKISNLDTDVLDELKGKISDGSIKIKHVAIIMMESLREELFPIQMGSDIHNFIMKSHRDDGSDEDDINARLARLSPNAEKITGKAGNWINSTGSPFPGAAPEWNDTAEAGFGGINVVGGLTTSSVSTKSLAAIHCGAWPMPVDKFEESETQSYQPCLPQVLELFNQLKEGQQSPDYLEQQWNPAFFQSVTDEYDRQKKFDKKIGFKHIFTKNRLESAAKQAHDRLEEINYFGYAETALQRYIEDYVKKSLRRNQRMFMSHFTSTTHHPWSLPSDFDGTHYLNAKGGNRWHKDFDKYLNTVRWNDRWVGQLMQTFQDLGIADETLVVFVGDHGQAFKEDVSVTGTYENGHISNFRVPISFRHPHIPRVQYTANATSLSIVPTILDLLISTGSLNAKDKIAATDLVKDYEGQSLIRPYKASHKGRRAWNFGVINAGGRMLSVTSADAPWRLVMPLDQKSEYRFTDLKNDPLELEPLLKWSVRSLGNAVKTQYGDEAEKWAVEAEAVARWWALERKRLWGYNPAHSEDDEEEEEEDEVVQEDLEEELVQDTTAKNKTENKEDGKKEEVQEEAKEVLQVDEKKEGQDEGPIDNIPPPATPDEHHPERPEEKPDHHTSGKNVPETHGKVIFTK